MRAILAIVPAILILAACGSPDQDAPPVVDDPAPAASGATLADFAGTWNNEVRLEGVAEPVSSRFVGSADGTGWVMNLEGRDPIPLRASVVGDSLITESETYESILRPGVSTRARSAMARNGNDAAGTVVVTYRTDAGDEVVRGTMRATRTP
ncbi:hypothetical protein BH23GEM9_BH23GEM9_35510 [soil metagenome]